MNKKSSEVTLRISANAVCDSNDESNFPHKLLLTDTQVSKIHKAFPNGLSANIKFSKTQLSKIVQLGGFQFSTGINDNPLMFPAKRFFSLMDSIETKSKNMGVKNKKW